MSAPRVVDFPAPRTPPGPGRRVTLFTSGDLWAGAAVQVYNTATALADSGGFDMHIVVLNDGELRRRLEQYGISVEVLPEGELGSVALVGRIRKVLRERRPELIHLHDYKLQVLVTAAKIIERSRTPVVRTFHSRPSRPGGGAELRVRLFQWLDKVSLRRSTRAIISVSEELRDFLNRQVPGVPTWTIPNGIRQPEAPDLRPQDVRQELGVPEDVCWIGTAIRLEAIKNPGLLLDAAALLKARDVPFALSIFGSGEMEDELRERIAGTDLEGSVILHGHDDRVVERMGYWDLFVLSSHHEGLPMSLLEAMALGVTPVSTAVGGIPEVVEDGHSGKLVDAGNAVAYADALQQLIEDEGLRRRLGRSAAELVRERFSVATMIEGYREVYGFCLGRRRHVAAGA